MDEQFLPWWLVLLLGLWTAALTIWQHPLVNREVRLWAGLSLSVYLGLIFLAVGLGPRGAGTGTVFLARAQFVSIGVVICIAMGLVSSVWMLGRTSLRSRRLCYTVVTLASAGFCALTHAFEIAIGLIIVAGFSLRPVFQRRPGDEWPSQKEFFASFVRFQTEPIPNERSGEAWLIAGLNLVLACVLVGTLAYSLRIESSRSTLGPPLTALPSREILQQLHPDETASVEQVTLLDLLAGRRADVVVLMAAIVFLCLAISLDQPARLLGCPGEMSNASSTETFSTIDTGIDDAKEHA